MAPRAPYHRPVLIAQLTDIHIGFDPAAGPEELNRVRLRAVLARLAALSPRPDLLVLSGDITDRGDADSSAAAAALVAPLGIPLLPLAGNHDSRGSLLAAFPEAQTEGGFLHYAVEREGLLIVCLDSIEEGRHGGAFCAARRDWLAQTLAARPGMPALLFMHHPPAVSGIAWMDPAPQAEWIARLAAALAGHEHRIAAICCGHLHRPLAARLSGIPVLVAPSVAPPVALDLSPIAADRPDGRALISAEPPGFALHRWDGEKLVTHGETVGDWPVLARYDEGLRPMVAAMLAERGE